jgi:hypothetical protein
VINSGVLLNKKRARKGPFSFIGRCGLYDGQAAFLMRARLFSCVILKRSMSCCNNAFNSRSIAFNIKLVSVEVFISLVLVFVVSVVPTLCHYKELTGKSADLNRNYILCFANGEQRSS